MTFNEKLIKAELPYWEAPLIISKQISDVFPFYVFLIFKFNSEDWNYFPQMTIQISLNDSLKKAKTIWHHEYYDPKIRYATKDRMYHEFIRHESEHYHKLMIENGKDMLFSIKNLSDRILDGKFTLDEISEMWIEKCKKHNFIGNS